jgi:hypothetical protein
MGGCVIRGGGPASAKVPAFVDFLAKRFRRRAGMASRMELSAVIPGPAAGRNPESRSLRHGRLDSGFAQRKVRAPE